MDAYDIQVAFDDVYGGGDAGNLAETASAVLYGVRSRRLAVPRMDVVALGADQTPWTFAVHGVAVLGADVKPTGLPVFDELHQRFTLALPAPKAVRLDDEKSYAEFREGRREPYVAKLGERLAAIEEAVAYHVTQDDLMDEAFQQHISDGHGAAVLGVLDETLCGGERIRLPLRDCANGKIECWRDGDELLCTIRVMTSDGPRMATTGTSVERHLEEVLGAAEEATFEDMCILGVPLAHLVGTASLIPQLCRVTPELLGNEPPFVGIMRPRSNPTMAAGMALLQRCQRGDRAACADAAKMMNSGGEKFLGEARDRLLCGQREKAARKMNRRTA